ncbi:MAG: hypothetical protein WBW54_05235, partial [Candidatus Acidiferrales bacterium]
VPLGYIPSVISKTLVELRLVAHITQPPSQPIFQQDFSEYMLEVPRRRPRFDWFLFAIVAGAAVGLLAITVSNLIF